MMMKKNIFKYKQITHGAIQVLGALLVCTLFIMNTHDAMAWCTPLWDSSSYNCSGTWGSIETSTRRCETINCVYLFVNRSDPGTGGTPSNRADWGIKTCSACMEGYVLTLLSEEDEGYEKLNDTCTNSYSAKEYNVRTCKECGHGEEPNADSTACVKCSAGTVKGSGDKVCVSCSPGSYQDQTGQDNCKPCKPGTYSKAGASTCSQCGANTYSGSGASSCISCPANATCCNGAPGCDTFTCNSGYKKEGGKCVEDGPKCDPVNEWNNNGTCTACPTYADCNGETFTCWNTFTNTGTQCVCNADQWVSNNQCTACPTYADCNGETFTCWNSFTKTNTACECGDRNWINTENCSPRAQCVSCPTDHFKQCGGTTLTCADNYRIQFEDNSCTATCIWNDCPDGSWGDENGCHPCPTDLNSFVECKGDTLTCASGYYFNDDEEIDDTKRCSPCPEARQTYKDSTRSTKAQFTSAQGATSQKDCYLAPGKYYDAGGEFEVPTESAGQCHYNP